jgi:uncharacterized protein (DUF924 family)
VPGTLKPAAKIQMNPNEILTFWFEDLTPKQHFVADDKIDAQIISRFNDVHTRALNSELTYWRDTPDGRLAEIIILNQFSLNMFRGNHSAIKLAKKSLGIYIPTESLGNDTSTHDLLNVPIAQSKRQIPANILKYQVILKVPATE